MCADVTVITPVAPYHLDKLDAIRATVAAQTVACQHIIVVDTQQQGPARARNIGLTQANGGFVVFLDADDWLEPDFIERCLRAYDGSAYVYTDWWQDAERMNAPDCAWVNSTWHCITTLLPTDWARGVGGFDETLPGGEDTDFYLKLTRSGFCGKRLAEPLFHYGRGGRRAAAFVHGPAYRPTIDEFTKRYGGKRMGNCGGCGDSPNYDAPPLGERQAGDVLVQAIWGGNRRERGPVTGRLYERAGNGAQMWVAPEDAQYAPHLWRRVEQPLPVPQSVLAMGGQPSVQVIDAATEESLTDLGDIAAAMVGGIQPAPPQPVEPVQVKPNARKVRELAAGMPLTNHEMSALKAGHELTIMPDETKVKRKRARDYTIKGGDE